MRLCALILLAITSARGAQAPAPPSPAASVKPALAANPLAAFSQSLRSLSRQVAPAVVEILVMGYGAPEDDGSGQAASTLAPQRSSGSGVFIDPNGYLITNAHVVQGAVSIQVLVANRSARPGDTDEDPMTLRGVEAKVIGVDRESDLALLKVDLKNAPTLRFAPPRSLRQGDLVLAVGSPLGLRNSVSMGVVSATARSVSESNPLVYIQTDASINPGNSGGALVDMEGRLVGINTFIFTQSGGNEGIGFAIPAVTVRQVYQQLRTKGHVDRGELGVTLQPITPSLAEGLALNRSSGLLVADVEPGGPAEKAGLRRADVILSVDGAPVRAANQFASHIYRRIHGETIQIEVLRGDQKVQLRPVVRLRSARMEPLGGMVSPEQNLVKRLGVLCLEIDEKIRAMVGGELRIPTGLMVAAKSAEGPGRALDLRPGDVIHAVNQNPAATVNGLRVFIDAMRPGDAVVLDVERDGRLFYVTFEIE